MQVFFKDGTSTEKVEVEYPLGHRRRRDEGIPLLEQKCRDNLATRFPPIRSQAFIELCRDNGRLAAMPVNEFMELLAATHGKTA